MKSFNRKVRRAGAKNRKVNFTSISLNRGDCFVSRRSLPSRNDRNIIMFVFKLFGPNLLAPSLRGGRA